MPPPEIICDKKSKYFKPGPSAQKTNPIRNVHKINPNELAKGKI